GGLTAGGQRAQRRDDVPVAVELRDVAKRLVRIEEQVLAPAIVGPVDGDLPHLEADDFVVDAEDLAARAERNLRLDADRLRALLQDADALVLRVENRSAALADDVDGVAEGTDRRRGAAGRTVNGPDLDARTANGVCHRYQPSKRRTLRSCS